MNIEEVNKANRLYDKGSIEELYEFIKPFLEKDDPYALYLSAGFSLDEWNESDEEYDKRYVDSHTKAADAGVPESMYRLSVLYYAGDMVERDLEKGRMYLNKALELNYGFAKITVGLNLYHGSNGYPKNIEKAIELLSEAVSENVEDAVEILAKIQGEVQH